MRKNLQSSDMHDLETLLLGERRLSAPYRSLGMIGLRDEGTCGGLEAGPLLLKRLLTCFAGSATAFL